MIWALLVSLSWAESLPSSFPVVPARGECSQSFAVVTGQPLSPELVSDGVALCRGVVVPTSKLGYLLAVEAEAPAHLADIAALKAERDELRAQRNPWRYRAEGASVIGIVTLSLWAGWYISSSRGGAK